MPKVSVMLLTKNRDLLVGRAVASVFAQSFTDIEVIVVDDGSKDRTKSVLSSLAAEHKNMKIISHEVSLGITKSRQEALLAGTGEYVAILDDDDEWADPDKLKKQVEYLDRHPETVLVGGAMKAEGQTKTRPQSDLAIRHSMLMRNNFFTSSVLFRKEAAMKAGGFQNLGADVSEDYDLWLRLGLVGRFYNFPEVFVNYRVPGYNRERFRQFLAKQLALIQRHKRDYPRFWLASLVLRLRLMF